MFGNRRPIPTSLLQCILDPWSIIRRYADAKIPQMNKCQSRLLYTQRRYLIYDGQFRYNQKKFYICPPHSVAPLWERDWALSQPSPAKAFSLRKCKMHHKYTHIIVQTMEKNLQLSLSSATSSAHSKSYKVLFKQTSLAVFSHEDKDISIIISMIKSKRKG